MGIAGRRLIQPVAVLAVGLSGDRPPPEFRLFESGWNETEKGRFLFDGVAAASVLEAYEDHGVDAMVDLEHLSLDPDAANFDPDARAWFSIELRENGELWAVNVKWTADGARRLEEKTQRYISPAFRYDSEGRITKLVNVALTALPATHSTPELVAARCGDGEQTRTAALAGARGASMNKSTILAALEAIAKGDAKKMAAILRELIAQAAATDGEAPAEPAAEPPPPPPEEATAAAADPAPAPDEGEGEARATAAASSPAGGSEAELATARLLQETGAESASLALASVAEWKKSHLAREADQAKLREERAALERSERLTLIGRLVELRCEDPATAWEDCTEAEPSKPVARLAREPIEDLRARVAKLSASRKGEASGATPPAGEAFGEAGAKVFNVSGSTVELSARELQRCEEAGAKPEVFAANKLARMRAQAKAN